MTEPAPTLDRALPTSYVDLLVWGIPKGQPVTAATVWSKFVSIAMSCQLRGWTKIQFFEEVARRERRKYGNGGRRWTRHRLWVQLDDLSRDTTHAFKSLDSAWDKAAENINSLGMHTLEDLRASAVDRAWQWADRIASGVDGFDNTDILVLDYVITSIEERGMARVTCPARAVAEHAKVSAMSASRRLKSLTERGYLVQHSPGYHSCNPGDRRAAIYCLPDPNFGPGGS